MADGRRDDVIVATKFHGPMDVGAGERGGDPNKRGNSRRWIIREVEHSLRRLQTDWIDLYQVHRPEPGTDIEETLAALTDLQRQGKIRHSDRQPSRHTRSSRRSGSPSAAGSAASSLSSRHIRSWCGYRSRCAARGREVRNGCHPVEPARRWLADRPLPQRPGHSAIAPRDSRSWALRHGENLVIRPSSMQSKSSRCWPRTRASH